MSSQSAYNIQLIGPPSPTDLAIARSTFITDPSTYNNETALNSTTTKDINADLFNAFRIRYNVFVHEQRYSAVEEIDKEDARSWQWVLYSKREISGQWKPAATVRLVQAVPGYGKSPPIEHIPGIEHPEYLKSSVWDKSEAFAKIGRLATVAKYRGRGYGRMVIEEAVRWAGENAEHVMYSSPVDKDGLEGEEQQEWKGLICAHAQTSVVPWYEKVGFEVDKDIPTWKEEGVDHAAVWRRVDVAI